MRIEPFAASERRCDAFLAGRVQLWQPIEGYRAGIDPVLLAAAVPVVRGDTVFELGCGAGAALCCLGARVPGLSLTGIELQPAYAALARENLALNGLDGVIVTADLAEMPSALRQQSFDAVLANPPYFEAASKTAARDEGRAVARAAQAPLTLWVDAATRRLKPRGFAVFIQRVERLPELMTACYARLGALELLPLIPREGRAPRLVILRARKGARAAFRFLPPLALHAGARHQRDGDDYAPAISDVLRNGAALPFST